MLRINRLMPQRSVEPPDPPPTWLVTGQESRVYRVTRCIVANTREEAETRFCLLQGEIETDEHLHTDMDLLAELQVEQIF